MKANDLLVVGLPYAIDTALIFPPSTSSPAPLLSFFFGFRAPASVRYLGPGSEYAGSGQAS